MEFVVGETVHRPWFSERNRTDLEESWSNVNRRHEVREGGKEEESGLPRRRG